MEKNCVADLDATYLDRINATVLAAVEEVRKRGGILIGVKPYSNHPDDHYLAVVLYQNYLGQYVTHSFNSQFPGFDQGHYHEGDLTAALKDFASRGVIHD